MYCMKCGKKVDENTVFCPACGAKVHDSIAEMADTAAQNTQEEVVKKSFFSEKRIKLLDKILLGLSITGTVGIVLFLGIVIVGASAYGRVYLFDGYAFTTALSIISLVFMMIGLFAVIAKIVLCFAFKVGTFPTKWAKRISLLFLAVCCLSFSIWGFVDCGIVNSKDDNYSSESDPSYNDYAVSPYLGLSLKVTSIKQSGNYSYVYCSVTNVSSTYGTATMYRYVKVKAVFYDRYNTMLDTDWTYAIDSVWLSSGEVKTFYYMVHNTSVYSAKLSIMS